MKNAFYLLVPFVLLAMIGIFLGIIIEVIVYITPFVRMLILLIAGLALLTFPLLTIKRYRHIAGNGMILLAIDVGLLTWLDSFSTTYHLAGKSAVIIGSLFLGLGIVPTAIFFSAVKGEWHITISIILMIVSTALLWMWGNRLSVPVILPRKQEYIPQTPYQYDSHDEYNSYDDIEDMPVPKGVIAQEQKTKIVEHNSITIPKVLAIDDYDNHVDDFVEKIISSFLFVDENSSYDELIIFAHIIPTIQYAIILEANGHTSETIKIYVNIMIARITESLPDTELVNIEEHVNRRIIQYEERYMRFKQKESSEKLISLAGQTILGTNEWPFCLHQLKELIDESHSQFILKLALHS